MKKELINGIFAVGLSLYTSKTLILGDVHIGYEEAMNKQGVLIPRRQYAETISLLEQTFAELKAYNMPVEKVIINGDLKHEFGTISDTEWRNTLGILDFLAKQCKSIVLIKGNHDTILGPIANKRNVAVKEFEVVGDVFVCHGDYITDKAELKKAKILIIGHEHPSVVLRQGGRVEKYKCFLVGEWQKKSLIVMPSFNTVVEGTDVLKDDLLSPFLSDIGKFEVFVSGYGEILDFGSVNKLRQLE
ncbi:MAG: metallophosphoesterase [Candidatus Nanoarchaeia archaeon]|nr:metallophosphoesterase [Candidatus Nanoarchaeia archaeon]